MTIKVRKVVACDWPYCYQAEWFGFSRVDRISKAAVAAKWVTFGGLWFCPVQGSAKPVPGKESWSHAKLITEGDHRPSRTKIDRPVYGSRGTHYQVSCTCGDWSAVQDPKYTFQVFEEHLEDVLDALNKANPGQENNR